MCLQLCQRLETGIFKQGASCQSSYGFRLSQFFNPRFDDGEIRSSMCGRSVESVHITLVQLIPKNVWKY